MSAVSTARTATVIVALAVALLIGDSIGAVGGRTGTGATAISTNERPGMTSFAGQHPPGAPTETRPLVRGPGPLLTPEPSSPEAEYNLTITESGLPMETPWAVGIETNCSGGEGRGTTTSSIVFALANGTYEWNVEPLIGYTYDASPSAGAVTVAGGPINVSVVYVPGPQSTYGVTFDDQGLPAGTAWMVNLSGHVQSTTVGAATGTLLVYQEVNGTYPFTVWSSSNYVADPDEGTIGIHGDYNLCQSVTFVPGYTVAFSESGLPTGASWSITLGGRAQSSMGGMIEFAELNGTYGFTVATADPEYAPEPASGSTVVEGGSARESVTFQLVTYTVTFTESGTRSGTEWWVNLTGGQSHSSTGPTLTFPEPNGTYPYSASAPGFSTQTGNLTVHGANPTAVQVNFSQGPSPSTGLPALDYAIIGGLLVAAGAIGAATVLWRRRGKAPPEPVTDRSEPGSGAPPAHR